MTTDVTTAPDGDLYYRYGEPPNKSSKMLLLHKHGCAVIGEWGDRKSVV